MRLTTPIVLAVLVAGTVGAGASGDPDAWISDIPVAETVAVRGATVWTQGPDGRLETADLLVRDGRIVAVGTELEIPADVRVIDGTGRHVTPGIIDAHSHTAVVGAVNEATEISTAQVRIADVIDADEVNVYRQLAGGTTIANILHGSANAIGGQNVVIKNRWGATPEQMVFDAAPSGIKFALGENPKQSNWGTDRNRYPQSRSGVEQIIRERFRAARDYVEAKAAEASGGPEVRRDLELEALAEILEGTRLVHAHSYRADEIIMLTRVAEDYGFTIATFQHVLEGYKVADELAAHGAGASTFADWWAYKYEVVDGNAYNGALMWERDVLVSYNSDSSDLARRLNLEAAKAVRYGGVTEEAALAFVTINPARQLGIDDRVGSLESGKDADFVIWNGHPLSTYSVVEQTWIDGRLYFDRSEDLARREAVAAERAALLAKTRMKPEEDSADLENEEPSEAEPDLVARGLGGAS